MSKRPVPYALIARLGLAGVYLLAGFAVVVLGPFIGTTHVPSGAFQIVLLLWAVGLLLLPVLGARSARRFVGAAALGVAIFLVWGAIVSGGLRSPFGY